MRVGYEVCRIQGVAVRLHPTFVLLLGVVALYALAGARSLGSVGLNLLVLLLLFLTVIWHELGHVLAARLRGIPVLDIVLTPLGGQARVYDLKDRPLDELVIALAAPLANLLVAAPMYLAFRLADPPRELTEVLARLPHEPRSFKDIVDTIFNFHFLLGTLNLLPFFPMDGGRALRALLALRIGHLEATRIACRIGFLAALLLLFQPLYMPRHPIWVLPIVGIFLFWTGLIERLRAEGQALLAGGRGGFVRTWTFGAPPGAMGGPRMEDKDEPPPQPASGTVIDTQGESRFLDKKDAP
jgi:Zn-dependent protease